MPVLEHYILIIGGKQLRIKTDRVDQLQQEIINQKHSFVWLADSYTEGVYLIDPYEEGFPFLYVNDKFTDMTGYGHEITGYKRSILEGADTDEKSSKKIQEVIECEGSATVEIVNYRKDGTSFLKEVYLNPLYDGQKELFAYIGVQKDITCKKTNENIQEKQAFQFMHDIHANMISFVNPDGIIEKTKMNSPSFKTVNTKVGEHFLNFVVEEDKEKCFQCFYNAMKGNVEHTQIRVVQDNQDIVELDVVFITSYSGQTINGAHTIYKNITGHNKTNKLLNDTEKFDAARRLSLSFVDAMKLPLASLKGFIQLSSLDASIEPNYFDVMLAEIERIELITTGLPFMLQPRLIEFKKENLRICLEYFCKVMYISALSENIDISLTYRTNIEEIDYDRKGLKYVFLQLLKNSIESMPFGGTIFIDVTGDTNDTVKIRVIDEGKGILEKDLEKVKQPFYTTKLDRIGLALTICNNIIKEHKGSLTLVSKENQGTIAEVVLPI